jgi:hypothetical protein
VAVWMFPLAVRAFVTSKASTFKVRASLGEPCPESHTIRSQCRKNTQWRTNSEHARLSVVDEGRKRVLLIAASILAARKLANWDGRPSPFLESTIAGCDHNR